MAADSTGPRVGDRIQVAGTVLELAAVGGVPGATVDVGARRTPVWMPLSVLVVTRRDGGR